MADEEKKPDEEPQRTPELQAQVEKELFGEAPDDQPFRSESKGPELSDALPPRSAPGTPPNLDDAIPQEPSEAAQGIGTGGVQMPTFKYVTPHMQHEGAKRAARKERLHGSLEPPTRDTSEGTAQGVRAPGFESIQGADDVAGAMVNYQSQLVSTLTTITKVLLDATTKLEQLENYLERLR